jgi:hypothetical protein
MKPALRSIPPTLALILLASCSIADTKLPPKPTVEYLPCTGMGLSGETRIDPEQALDIDTANWGGWWTEGDEWHVGLVDVGTVDWQQACPAVGDPNLVVHEVPHSFSDLEQWQRLLTERSTAEQQSSVSVDAGQYVIEVHAPDLDTATEFSRDIPLDAWAYQGPVLAP